MARKDWDAEGLRELFVMLDHAHRAFRHVLDGMEEAKMPTIFVHADTVKNRELPNLQDWADKLVTDFDIQRRAHERGQKDHKAKGKRPKK